MALRINGNKDVPHTPKFSGSDLNIVDLKYHPIWPKLRSRLLEYLECIYLYDNVKSYMLGLGKMPFKEREQEEFTALSRELVQIQKFGKSAERLRSALDE